MDWEGIAQGKVRILEADALVHVSCANEKKVEIAAKD